MYKLEGTYHTLWEFEEMALLDRTKKFRVWSTKTSENLQVTHPVERNSSSVVVVGGRKVTVSDVARVAALMYAVTLDCATVEKIDSDLLHVEHKAESTFSEMKNVAENTANYHNISICRAALFARVVSLMQCRSGVRSEVIEVLVDMLNADVTPNFSSPDLAGLELCAIITNNGGSCTLNGVVMSSSMAFTLGGIIPVGLSTSEVSTIKMGQFFITGCTCLIASGAANLGLMIDCISALSCDSFGASAEPFEAVHFDTCRQHRGQIASATNLRLLLEGSKRTLASSSEAFSSIPQLHGPSLEAINSTVK